ncbi:MAG: hypothetical protein NTX11_00675 [Candidatus Saccharibacteria bacterium]|nr:hypothetical protein [Candidatus Saccharibacteria bacterium]
MATAKKVKSSNNSKIKFSNQSISLNSTKGRVIVTVLAFVVIGGGLMVYRSFAATASWTFNAASKTLTAGVSPSTSPCKTQQVELGDSKNPNPGFYMTCTADTVGANMATVIPQNVVFDTSHLYKDYRLCANVKAPVGGQAKIEMFLPGYPTGAGAGASYDGPVSTTFADICTPKIAAVKVGAVSGRLIVKAKGVTLTVASMRLEEVANFSSTASTGASASTSSTAAPAPAK